MTRTKMPIGERIALVLSVAALVVSLWSLVESRRAASQARWSEFRTSTLITLDRHRRAYSRATCVLHATGMQYGLESREYFKSNLDNLEGTLSGLRGAEDDTLVEFETLLDASHASFRRLSDAVTELKSHLTQEELSRVAEVCGDG